MWPTGRSILRYFYKKICQEISDVVVRCITAVSRIIEKGRKEGIFDADNPWKLSWILWSIFVGIGHLNEARHSLNVTKNDFEELQGLAYSMMIKSPSK